MHPVKQERANTADIMAIISSNLLVIILHLTFYLSTKLIVYIICH